MNTTYLQDRVFKRMSGNILSIFVILAIAFPVVGSVYAAETALPIGYHDGSNGTVTAPGCTASGWAVDPDNPDRDLQIQILADGNPVATTTANLLREDVGACSGGTCGFGINLWGLISAGQVHQITARAYDEETSTWVALQATPKTLTCWGYPEGAFDGHDGLAGSDSCGAFGWVFDPDNPTRDVEVRILADGNVAATTTANLLREDVMACTGGTCGFGVNLWGLISLGAEHQIVAQAYDVETGGWIDIDPTPKFLTCQLPTFTDVQSSYWAWSFIERLYQAGITGGCALNPLSYCPAGTVTRAQMAVFLLRGIHGSTYNPPAVGGSTGFGDVPTDYWSGAWIKQLAAEGITSGCGGSSYCPEHPVTRAQMAVFLLRSKYGAGYTPPAVGASTGFGDVPTEYWSASWIKQLVTEGITAGCGSGNYCPEAPVTRAQMAVFLVRTFNLP
jgi:hypothetical protein